MKKITLTNKKLFFTINLLFFILIYAHSQTTQTFSNFGTFTVPAEVTSLIVEAWGGGGKGGSIASVTNAGGVGAYGKKKITVVPGVQHAYIVNTESTSDATAGESSFSSLIPTVRLNAKCSNNVADNTITGSTVGLSSNYSGDISFSGVSGATDNEISNVGGEASAEKVSYSTTPSVPTGATALAGVGNGGVGINSYNNELTKTISGGGVYHAPSNNRTGGYSEEGKITVTWAAPEMNIQGNTVSISNNDTTPTATDWSDFGSTQIFSAPITRIFTIQNTGNSGLTIGTISFSGTNASDFTITKPPSSTIVGGSSSTFIVTFNPNAIGWRTAKINIVNNDADENPYNFAIQGTGTQVFYDSDGDGIFDNVDIDDDNDGILDVTEEANCNSANGHKVDYKFLNETFGTGSRTKDFTAAYNATTTYCYEDGIAGANTTACPSQSTWILDDGEYTVVSKITGTVASDSENIHGDLAWYNGEDHTPGDTNGRMAVFNASYTPGTFYETTINGVLPNLPITYSFWVMNILSQNINNDPNMIDPNITVEFLDLSGNVITFLNTGDVGRCSSNVLDNNCTQGVWQQFTTNVNLGNVNAFVIRFKNNAPGGGGNDLALDDILISQTLCDLDNDGVADLFDLDSDNDGISDVVEVGLGNLSNGKGKIAVAWVDTNTNGLHDSAESSAALAAVDSDRDGLPNYMDLDSDNDSVFDVDESGAGNTGASTGFVNGDGDVNGDGVGDGSESEKFRNKDTDGNGLDIVGFGDGILDIYDYGTGDNQYGNFGQGSTVAPFLNYLLDTDGDGIPDYIDVKSNGITFDIANTLLIYDYKTLDTNKDGIIDGTTDADKDGIMDAFDTNTAVFGSPRDLRTKLFLDFDGRNDYGQSTSILGGLTNASLMAWINLNPAFSTEGVIVGQDKYQIRITADRKLEAVVNGTTAAFATALNVSQWYNVATVYDGNNLKLYLNGALVATQAASGSIAADASLLTLGKNPIANTKYFKGKIDEVRVFNVALTASHLQRMVYQEIEDNGSQIRGTVIPKNIASTPATLPFANLLRYYRMDTYKDDIIDDLTTPSIDVTGTKIYNHKNIYLQQAPLPFVTEKTGTFATAVNSPTKEILGTDIMENDWSIVKVQHDITETANNIDLGMMVDSGKKIVMNNNTKIQNNWYLKLDGTIDLNGMSQLLQTRESDLDATSSGSIERDQQGQLNKYNYNYWSSPVSPINNLANNKNYTVDEVMKDGNTSIPRNITWKDGYDGSATSPISLARYWIYKFDSYANAYANWVQIGETGTLRVGQGFTLKGSGALVGSQNYTFAGKPNNGLINSNSVGKDQLLLTGNPYPSALNVEAFINDNSSSTTGTLYFWEHYTTNNTHILRDYQGGYAARNLTGGLAPSSSNVDFISKAGTPSKGIPKQYIPVGQGFFVSGHTNPLNSAVIFKNSQRAFIKENNTTSSNVLYKIKDSKKEVWDNNDNDATAKDTIQSIRLGFNSHNDYHKQLLLGFMNEKATDSIDYGYDGASFDNLPNDIYFLAGESKLIIQGVGYFNTSVSYPIGVKTDAMGKVQFLVDELENFVDGQQVYIYDSESDSYHNIINQPFEITLPIGEFHNRFSLRFKDKTLGTNEQIKNENDITILHLQNRNSLVINNKLLDTTVQEVTLFNILGQPVAMWEVENQGQESIQLPIKKVSSGVYIVKIKTSAGVLSKKIIIN